MPRPHIRILCVEDHALVREGIGLIINLQDDMKVIASATNGAEGVEMYRRHRPDVTLMDLKLPGMSGLDAIRAIRSDSADAKIVVLTMYDGDADINRSLKAGAAAYVLKDSLSADLIRTIREVHAGRSPILDSRDLSRRQTGRELTAREIEVIELIAQGQRNKEVAATLGISEETVQAHLRHVFTKLEVRDRAAAIAVAVKRGYVHL